ncbi:MAG TPA: hydantoinase/oxoprolinase family protein, partial [Longimicrobiales bacterium]|nr:hydantoinase/oxoprolinase family protein [Longimicrobiales bacterium]
EAGPGAGGRIRAVMVGTNHFVNALLQGEGLTPTAVFRLCGPATRLLPPFCDWPPDLREACGARHEFLPGGHEFDGREITGLDEEAVAEAGRRAADAGIGAVALCGVFSPVNPEHEARAAGILAEAAPGLSLSLSHEIGRIGLLERESAAALNGALTRVARCTVPAIREALAGAGVEAPLHFSQNDGTLMDGEFALRYPVRAIASGPTNSMRGGALLTGAKDAVVVDVGGTTTDVGVLVDGFPRPASVAVELAGVRTNFRMPDLLSLALGGGSRVSPDPVEVGPGSVGAALVREARVFGGDTLTATDVAVADDRCRLGDPGRISDVPESVVAAALERIRERVEEAVDRMKLSPDPVPVILVGGGSVLLGDELAGASEILRPDDGDVANAVGAAVAQVGGEVDRVFSMAGREREGVLAEAREAAVENAVEAGADAATVELVDVEEVPLTYLPGNAVRVRARAVGRLAG